MISDFEALVLVHTAETGRYVTSEVRVLTLAARGLLCDHGAQQLAAGDHYLTLTRAGRQALAEWRAAQPRPPRKRRASRAWEAWRTHVELGCDLSFSQFLRTFWAEGKGRL